MLGKEILFVLFTGEYDFSIDQKGRLAIPAEIRTSMHPDHDGKAFYLTLGPNRTLCLYPEKIFDRLVDQIEEGLVPEESVQEFGQLVFPLATRLEWDTAGRVKISDRMRVRAGLKDRKVTLIGVRDHLEIRDRERWQAELEDRLAKQEDIFKRFARRRRNGAEGER